MFISWITKQVWQEHISAFTYFSLDEYFSNWTFNIISHYLWYSLREAPSEMTALEYVITSAQEEIARLDLMIENILVDEGPERWYFLLDIINFTTTALNPPVCFLIHIRNPLFICHIPVRHSLLSSTGHFFLSCILKLVENCTCQKTGTDLSSTIFLAHILDVWNFWPRLNSFKWITIKIILRIVTWKWIYF